MPMLTVMRRSWLIGIALAILGSLHLQAATVFSAGIPCSDAGSPCSGGPWVNGYVDPGPGIGNFISQTDAVPFNDFRGFDGELDEDGSNFAASWAFSYAAFPLGTAVNSASITLALFDHDSAASGNQVASFVVEGANLTAELNALLNASGGSNFEYNIYTLNLPGSLFLSLLDGAVTASLTLQGPSLVQFIGFPPTEASFNGAGLDYSLLTIDAISDVPEPSSWLLTGLGLAATALLLRRKRTA